VAMLKICILTNATFLYITLFYHMSKIVYRFIVVHFMQSSSYDRSHIR